MFNKKVELTILTRFKNEDNFKIERLISTWKEPCTLVSVNAINNEDLEITFTTTKSCIKEFKRNLNLLNFIGIEGSIK